VVNLALAEFVLTNSPWEFAPSSDEQPDSANAIKPTTAIIFTRAPIRLRKCVAFACRLQVVSPEKAEGQGTGVRRQDSKASMGEPG